VRHHGNRIAPPPMTVHGWLRYDVFERLLPDRVASILEIGAGVGAVGSLLAKRYHYVGLEPDPESCAEARSRVGGDGVVLCVREEDLETDEGFDLVCAFEVLEHIEDDVAALRRWQRRLATGGSLIVSVPAGRDRFGPTDARQGHFRRYDREDLVAALTRAGFVDIDAIAYHAPTLDARTASSGRWMQPARGRLRRVVARPFALAQRPFESTRLGTGLVARARLAR
jgi:SAM-dependent methyltransferase